MMPTPSHLTGCVKRKEAAVDEAAFDVDVRCPCGSRLFDLLYPGETTEYNGSPIPVVAEINGLFFFRIKARCVECGTEHLLFDKDFHGWDGFVCHDEAQASLPRPVLIVWDCLECGEAPHEASIQIQTQGKENFVEETEGKFAENRWPDGFSAFSMRIRCNSCSMQTPQWVSYETM